MHAQDARDKTWLRCVRSHRFRRDREVRRTRAEGARRSTPRRSARCATPSPAKGGKSSPLDGVGTKLSAADIKAWIVTPVEAAAKAKSTKKPPMPAKYGKLPAADLDALVAYMVSLK